MGSGHRREEFKLFQSWLARLQSYTPETAPARALAERGQGMVEYALILVLIAIAAIAVLTVIGGTTSNVYSNINNGLSLASPSATATATATATPTPTPTAKPTKTPKATPTPKPTKTPKS